MALTKVSWKGLKKALDQAGVIIADDEVAVTVSIDDDEITLTRFNGEPHARLIDIDNETVDASGASLFVQPWGGEPPMQLSFYRTWVIDCDAEIIDA